jgi:hypothetical protein
MFIHSSFLLCGNCSLLRFSAEFALSSGFAGNPFTRTHEQRVKFCGHPYWLSFNKVVA